MTMKQEHINQLADDSGKDIGFMADIETGLREGIVFISPNTLSPSILLMYCPSGEHFHSVYIWQDTAFTMKVPTYHDACMSCMFLNENMTTYEQEQVIARRFVAIPSDDFQHFVEDRANESLLERLATAFAEYIIEKL